MSISFVLFSLNLVYVEVRTALAHVIIQVGSSNDGLLVWQVLNSFFRLYAFLKFLNNTTWLAGMSQLNCAAIFSVLVYINLRFHGAWV